jgi:hypothetical protein
MLRARLFDVATEHARWMDVYAADARDGALDILTFERARVPSALLPRSVRCARKRWRTRATMRRDSTRPRPITGRTHHWVPLRAIAAMRRLARAPMKC